VNFETIIVLVLAEAINGERQQDVIDLITTRMTDSEQEDLSQIIQDLNLFRNEDDSDVLKQHDHDRVLGKVEAI